MISSGDPLSAVLFVFCAVGKHWCSLLHVISSFLSLDSYSLASARHDPRQCRGPNSRQKGGTPADDFQDARIRACISPSSKRSSRIQRIDSLISSTNVGSCDPHINIRNPTLQRDAECLWPRAGQSSWAYQPSWVSVISRRRAGCSVSEGVQRHSTSP